MASHVAKTIGDGIDGRLRIQYAITTMCAQKVSLNAMATQIISVLILCFDWIGCRLCAIPSTYPHQCVGPLCAHDSPSCAAVASSCWWFCCCGSFVGTTGLCNGWKGWKCGQGKCIDNYKLNPIGNSSSRKKNCHFIPFWIDVDLCVHWCQIPPSKAVSAHPRNSHSSEQVFTPTWSVWCSSPKWRMYSKGAPTEQACCNQNEAVFPYRGVTWSSSQGPQEVWLHMQRLCDCSKRLCAWYLLPVLCWR